MKKKYLFETPLFQFLEKMADLIIANILTGILILPIITAGPALAACCKVMQNIILKEERPVFAAYFRSFRENFKQGMVLGLLAILVLAILSINLAVVYLYFKGTIAYILYMVLLIAAIMLLGTTVYAFSLMARYNNTLKQHLHNGFFLALGYLPRTVVMLALYSIPLVLAIYDINALINSLVFWLIIGFSLTVYASTKLIAPVFLRLDEQIADQESELEEACSKMVEFSETVK